MAELGAGARIGGYTVSGTLGRGGMGVVYEARDPSGRKVAIKVVADEMARDAAFRDRFRREARAGASVAHRNVVAVIESGEDAGRAFLVLEHVPQGSLKERVRREGLLDWREAAALGAQIARGLAAVHEGGLVHRDLKPENVLLASEGEKLVAKLSDFGLVGAHSASLAVSQALTRTGEMLGTLAYMSPEQANGERDLTPRSDLYSLGALLHFLLTGSPPFQGTGYDLVKKHLLAKPPSPREAAPEVPERLERLVLSLLEKKPAQRPESAGAVARELDEIARIEARALPWKPIAAALVLAAIVGTAIFLVSRGEPGEERTPPSPVDVPPKTTTSPRTTTPTPSAESASRLARERGEALFEKKDFAGAVREFTRAIDLDPRSAAAWGGRAGARNALHDYAAGASDASRAIELDPRDAKARYDRGAARVALHAPGGREDLDAAIALDPGLGVAWANRAFLRLDTEREGALADVNRAIALDPGHALSWGMRAFLRKATGDLDHAIGDFEHFVAAFPDDPSAPDARREAETLRLQASPPRDAKGFALRAQQRIEKLDWEGALADATEALEVDPRLALAWECRGVVRFARRDHEGAEADMTRALELDPDRPQALANRAAARGFKADWDGAIADATRAIALDPKLAAAYRDRGIARANGKGDTEGAVADYTRSLELDPRDAQTYTYRGSIYMNGGRMPDALADFTKAVELVPDEAAFRGNRAAARFELGDRKGAAEDYKRCLELGAHGRLAEKALEALREIDGGR